MRLPVLLVYLLALSLCNVRGQEADQQPRRSRNWPCVSAKRIDPGLVRNSEASGGHVMMLDSSEIMHSTTMILWRHEHEETIFRAAGQLDGSVREFAFPVDSTVESLLLSASIQCQETVSFLRPNGEELQAEQVAFRAGRIARFARPEPGVWRIRVAGRGHWFAAAEAKSPLALDSARFVYFGGRPAHEGWFPLKDAPTLGTQQALMVELSGEPASTRLRLISSTGETLEFLEAPPEGPAQFLLRHPEFRIAIDGRDAAGWHFQRIDPRLLSAQPPGSAPPAR